SSNCKSTRRRSPPWSPRHRTETLSTHPRCRVSGRRPLAARTNRPVAKAGDPWIEASDVVPMFPTLLWKIAIKPELRDAIDARVLAMLQSMRRDLKRLESGCGWQSEQALHEREELRDLVACIGNATRSVLRLLQIGHEAFESTACWATVLATGAAHRAHSHRNKYLS